MNFLKDAREIRGCFHLVENIISRANRAERTRRKLFSKIAGEKRNIATSTRASGERSGGFHQFKVAVDTYRFPSFPRERTRKVACAAAEIEQGFFGDPAVQKGVQRTKKIFGVCAQVFRVKTAETHFPILPTAGVEEKSF